MRVAVIGAGVEGRAAEAYWVGLGCEVMVYPTAADLPAQLSADLLVRSPGVRPDTLPKGAPVTSVTAEFIARCRALVIGVTGTKGKGTTCTAIASILAAAGRRVFVAGNIGTPPLALLPELRHDDVVVLELSSFQLMDLDRSPPIAVLLAITPDHLNWHLSLAEYHDAKAKLVAHQGVAGRVIYAAENPVAAELAARSPGRLEPMPGDFVVHGDGIAAMAAFDQPKVLILGGSSKGVSFDPLAQAIATHDVRAILVSGGEAGTIAEALRRVGLACINVPGPMAQLVAAAAAAARPGDVVLLSPACSSVGEFAGYADRGEQFAAAVKALTN